MRAYRSTPKSQQHGISFLGLLFVAIVLACTGIVAAQLVPTLIEWQAIDKAVNKAKDGTTVPEIRANFDRSQAIDDFKLSGKDIDVQKVGEKIVVAYSYEREIHLFGPAFLTMKYKGQSR